MSTADFAFPLNVYARMLEAGEGRLDYLHYGLFERDDEPVWQAQERASQRLWAALPPPCRVLEVGIGIGTTLRRLGEAGYQAVGITPDPAQVAEVQYRHGAAVRVLTSSLEALDRRHGPWDLMLLQESAQYIDPLALFEAADRLLVADDAQLVVMDEFAFDRCGADDTGLHDHAHFLALARRMGWEVLLEEDVSSKARGTLVAIERLVRQQRERLEHELDLAPALLDGLIIAAERYRRLYERGVYGYRLLRLTRRHRPVLRLGDVGPAQAPAMRAEFAQVFGKTMDAAEWHWKYGDDRGRAVGLWQGDELVAHCGATSRRCRIDGRLAWGCQVGDVMVLPQANAGLNRQGALHQVTATLLEREIGWGRAHLVGFGFPNVRALKVAERLGLYAAVDEVVQLDWPVRQEWRRADAMWHVEPIDPASLVEGSRAWRELEHLSTQMADGMPNTLLPLRDPQWLRHRYGRRPGVVYRLLMQRHHLSQRAQGAMVLRDHDDHVELMDLIGPPAALKALVRAARMRAEEDRPARGGLRAWITRSHLSLLDDPADLAQQTEMGVMVPTSVHTAGPTPDSLRGRWFLMAGDTDFR